MLSFFKKAKSEELEHVTQMMEWYAEDIEKLPNQAARLHAEGNHDLAFRNHCDALRAFSDLALLQWRQRIDPQPTIRGLVSYYPEVISYLESNDPDDKLGFRDSLFGFDTDLMDAMGWLSGLSSEIHDHAKPDRQFFYGCSNFLLRIAMGVDVPKTDSDAFVEQINSKTDLPHNVLQDTAKILGVIEADVDLETIVQRAERNWELRETSNFFEKHVGTSSGFGKTNYLYLDFYLAAALNKVGWEGDTIHKWIW